MSGQCLSVFNSKQKQKCREDTVRPRPTLTPLGAGVSHTWRVASPVDLQSPEPVGRSLRPALSHLNCFPLDCLILWRTPSLCSIRGSWVGASQNPTCLLLPTAMMWAEKPKLRESRPSIQGCSVFAPGFPGHREKQEA